MNVLVAFDKFKDCLSASQACEVVEKEVCRLHPDWTVVACPLTDGGEGFAPILTASARGIPTPVTVAGPRTESGPVQATLGIVNRRNLHPAVLKRLNSPSPADEDSHVAVVEMASASGLALLPPTQRDVWRTQTRGTGELLRLSRQRLHADSILLGLGGSATHDLGLGALKALGMRFLDHQGNQLDDLSPNNWASVARMDSRDLIRLPPIWMACDVTNPLLGPTGAAAVYAKQKGLRPQHLPRLESETERMGRLLCEHFEKDFDTLSALPGCGAAGGIAFGLMTACEAQLVPGFPLVTDWLQLQERIACADLVITGEGSFDDSSLSGKGPGTLVRSALAKRIPAHVFAGRVDVSSPPRECSLYEITPRGIGLAEAIKDAEHYLRTAVQRAFAS